MTRRPHQRPFAAAGLLACVLAALAPAGAHACSGGLHVEVGGDGIYALDYAAIIAQQPGLADCTSDSLALLQRGAEVPIRIVGADGGRFASGARIEWIGQALHGPESWFDPYSAVNVYQLVAVPGAHARMREIAGAAAASTPALLQRAVHFEQENLLLRFSDSEMKFGEEPDAWQWAKLTPIDPKPFSLTFDLADADVRDARGATPATLTIAFYGESTANTPKGVAKLVDHIVDVALNGRALPQQSWDGRGPTRRQFSVPRGWLKQKGNVVTLRVVDRPIPDPETHNFVVDVVMLNWIELDYTANGDLDADAAPFTAAAGAVELASTSKQAPELFALDGGYERMTAARAGRWRAPNAHAGKLLAATPAQRSAPTLVRPIRPGDPRSAEPGYDYVIVAHPRLLQAIQPLAQYHRTHGHRVAVFDVDDLYDAFNGGIAHPSAIRDAVAWGYEHWQVKPHYLLLVGDASNDIYHDIRQVRLKQNAFAGRPRPYVGEMMSANGAFNSMPTTLYPAWSEELANRNLVPTWQVPSQAYGQSASDNPYAMLRAGSFHPLIAVGRIPVVEPEEVTAVVDKTLEYFERPAPGSWHRDVAFISTDELASYKRGSDEIAASLGRQGFYVDSLYTKSDAKEALFARATLKKLFDTGDLLVHFLGHGGQYIWRVGPPADLFTLEDVSALTNKGRYPIVLAMTCFSAPFDNPTADSIGERLLREPDRGAVAVFAASWTNSPLPEHSKVLVEELVKPGITVGDAILAAKSKTQDRTFVETYNLLGDPALVPSRPREQLEFMRDDERWDRQVLVRVPERDFGGNVRLDWFDDKGRVLASREYESRDRQFAVTVPQDATELRAFANDLRSGYLAFGRLALADAAPPPAIAGKPAAKSPTPAAPPAAPVTKAAAPAQSAAPARVRPSQHDTIVQANFDAAAPVAASNAHAGKRHVVRHSAGPDTGASSASPALGSAN